MNNQGFIKIYRKMLDWEWIKKPNDLALLIHCLLKANWKDGKFEGIIIERGSFATSLKNLSEESGLTIRQVRTSLNHLISTNTLTNKSYSNFRVITVNNYNSYQVSDKEIGKQATSKRQTSDKQATTIEEIKNSKNRKNSKKSVCNTHNTDDSHTPSLDEVIAYGVSLGKDENYCRKFYNNYSSINWMIGGTKITNWKSKFDYWVEQDKEKGKSKKESVIYETI